jgi:gamma-glutamyltranspeptidase/glutathione hydrolase
VSRRAYRILPTEGTTFHPRLFGTRGAVAANSNLSVAAGVEILRTGGNAIDAAVAACFVEGLVNPQMHTIGGECPILVRPAGERRVYAVNGNMAAPGSATPEAFRARGLADVPSVGILAAGVPAAFGAFVTALERWGTLP